MTFAKIINFSKSLALLVTIVLLKDASSSEAVYITVYGRISSGTSQTTVTTGSYKECMELCVAMTMCVVAYGNKNCQLYNYGNVNTVTQLDETTSGPEDYVTFRVNQESSTCPAKPAVNPPTFDNYQATGLVLSNNVSNFYRITSKSGVWSFETLQQNTNLACPSGWNYFVRRYGIVCTRGIWRKYTSLTCSDYLANSYTSGIESVDELNSIKNSVMVNTYSFLNAKMTTTCRTTGNCGEIMLGTYLTAPARIPWLPGYPTATGDCIAAATFDNVTFGLVNIPCESTSGVTYCVYFPT